MCPLFYENGLGIKKIVISFVYLFCLNTGTKFPEPYHSNHMIPHREGAVVVVTLSSFGMGLGMGTTFKVLRQKFFI